MRGRAGGSAGRWQVCRLLGGASDLHHRPWPAPPVPTVWFLTVERPALVLGSTQPLPSPAGSTAAAAAAAGIEVVRRRSGGGAVLVDAGSVLWVDVLVPAGDRHWDPDVGRAFLWLGDAWVRALAAAGVAGAEVHRGPADRSPLARAVCFAGLGPGEVTVAGRKVVGMSQRRTRDAALFQCAALLRWDPTTVAALVGVPAGGLETVAAGLATDGDRLSRCLLAELGAA